jgi:type IV pilus assembly protein PilW
MKAMFPRLRSKSAGFSLVELMVALVLSLLILGGVIAVYMNNSDTARFQTGVMRTMENGRFAIDVLSRTLRMAGYDDPDVGGSVGAVFVSGTTGSTGTSFTQSDLNTGADTVSVTYEGGTEIRDCQGGATSSSSTVTNQYAVSTDASGVSHLVCNTANDNGQPLAEGVEDMQILYGLDVGGNGVPDRYVDADNVGDWSQVVSIQVALLVSSVVPALSADDTVCLGCTTPEFAVYNDRLVRAEFQTTIGIRN